MADEKYPKHHKEWFMARIGKRIFRINGAGRECCLPCEHAQKEGFNVGYPREGDRSGYDMHVCYLLDAQDELGYRYDDKKMER